MRKFKIKHLPWVPRDFYQHSFFKKKKKSLFIIKWASLVAQMVENLPPVQETWVWSLSWEDPVEKGMVTHSSILVWRIPWTEEPGGWESTESQSPAWMSDEHTNTIPCIIIHVFIFI